jgi:hypothetical protein
MDMDEIWPLGAQQLGKFSPRVVSPDGLPYQHQSLNPGIGVNLPITSTVGHDIVPRALQEFALLLEDDVFTARLLVIIVNEDYLHDL